MPILAKEVRLKFSITGIVYLESGSILVSNWTRSRLELWDNNISEVLSYLSFSDYPHAVRMTSDTDGFVAVPGTGLVKFKIENGQLSKISTVKVVVTIDFVHHQNKTLVGWLDKIITLDSYHRDRRCDVDLSHKIGNMAIRDGHTLCYSVHRGDVLHCITMDGTHVFSYAHDKLQNVKGITMDNKGCIYVCGYDSKNVHQLSHDGKLQRIIMDDLPAQPRCMSFNEQYDQVVIGCDWAILVYKLPL